MSTLSKDSKYYPLFVFLRQRTERAVELGFGQIERLLGDHLPRSAWSGKAFWSNRESGGLQSAAWMEAGYHVASIDLKALSVVFERPRLSYEVERREGEVLWSAPAIRALRNHLDLNQQGMADLLGVRQQTVSEWETGTYQPTRATCKHLTMVAEQADFPFTATSHREVGHET